MKPYQQAALNNLRGAEDTITYTQLKWKDNAFLIEFSWYPTFLEAVNKMSKAFPDKGIVTTGYSAKQKHQIVLATDEEVTYFKLIEGTLRDERN